jgi:TRAP-type C4-dicarboxylate transport system substrate-binding protein
MVRFVLLGVLLLGLVTSQAGARDIKIATLAPDGSAWMLAMREAAAKVEEGSEGRLRFKFYPAGVMGSDATVLRKIRLGQLQGAALTGSEASLVESNAGIYSLPFLLRDEAELEAVREQIDARLVERFSAAGMQLLSINNVGFAYLMSTRPIRSTDDLRSAKVWIPQNDRIAEVTFRSGGVSPTSLPLGDVFTSLQTGLVDTVANTWSGAIGLQWHTRLKYAIDLPLTMVMGFIMIDGKVFDRIDPADQELMLRSFTEASRQTDERFRRDNAGARGALLKQGLELLPISGDDAAHWRAIGAQAAGELSRAGTVDAALLEEVQSLLARHRSQSGSKAD